MDVSACNYNAEVTGDDGSCIYVDDICESCSGETDGTGTIVDNDIDDDDICDVDEILGCMDSSACNYDVTATDEDGSCIYSEITVEYIAFPTSCAAVCDGAIEANITNGLPPYTAEYTFVDGLENITYITGSNLTNACSGSFCSEMDTTMDTIDMNTVLAKAVQCLFFI